jgi:purine-binding chemotaxis protein CheW
MTRIARSEESRLCTFYLADERYGIDILTVREVQRNPVVTPARGAARSVRGFVNLRGRIATVIDPAIRLGHQPCEIARQTRLVILKSNDELPELDTGRLETCDDLTALCVDRVSDVVAAAPALLDAIPASAGEAAHRLLRGILQLDDEVVRVIDPAALLQLEEDA